MSQISIVDQSEDTTLDIHWGCGKVNCDCDEQYEQLKDYETGLEGVDYADCY